MALNTAPMRRLVLVAAGLAAVAVPAQAAQEPYGQTIQGWRFTQDIENGRPVCRAFSPGPTRNVIIQRLGSGTFVMSVPASNVRAGQHEEASFEVGRSAEPVNARADGNRVYLPVDDPTMGLVIQAGRFRWAVNGRRQMGDVAFNPSLGAAVNRLRQCTRANGGR